VTNERKGAAGTSASEGSQHAPHVQHVQVKGKIAAIGEGSHGGNLVASRA
jgi:hypothetical protein